ncbi:hypothetical protein [Natroniella sp. ANB-PHB2]|uniref:hypothetical protein n=1 Tax=Natroniella sp. ANB-PHB2 TaxID=3384444 RepID=UPI0038D3A2A5
MKKVWIITLLLSFLIIGCSSSDSSTPSVDNTIATMGINNAESLFITEGSSLVPQSKLIQSGNEDAKRLFKITPDGYIQEVTYYNEDGKEIETIDEQPAAIYDVNSEYIIVGFGYNKSNINNGYLVRKSDGAVFDISNAGFPKEPMNYFKNVDVVKTDSTGNLYYRAGNWPSLGITKLDTENLTGTILTPEHHNLEYFTVDAQGNIAYWARDNNDTSNSVKRIIKTNGGMEFLDSRKFWRGLDNKIHYVDNDENKINRILINDSFELEVETYGSTPENHFNLGFNDYKIEIDNRIIIARPSGDIYEVYNNDATPRKVNVTISDIVLADASDNYYYLFGDNGKLIRVNPSNDSTTTLLDEEYDIYKMNVSSDDKIIFNALKMEDGATVIGEIDPSGDVNIISDTLEQEVVSLERIN